MRRKTNTKADSGWDNGDDKNALLLGHRAAVAPESREHLGLAGHGGQCQPRLVTPWTRTTHARVSLQEAMKIQSCSKVRGDKRT
jgi:hypothetical protein